MLLNLFENQGLTQWVSHRHRTLNLIAMVCILPLTISCDDEPSSINGGSGCVPGQSVPCVGSECSGAHVCNGAGLANGACVCADGGISTAMDAIAGPSTLDSGNTPNEPVV